jgi:hypothetical protein
MLQILDRDGNDLYRATVDQYAFGTSPTSRP